MFNMQHSAVLLDLARFLRSQPEAIDMIDSYGIRTFLQDARENDEQVLFEIELNFNTPEDVNNFNYVFGTRLSKKEIINEYKKSFLILPHANYKNVKELADIFTQIHYDNPDFFRELAERPYLDVHNELIERYGNIQSLNN